MLETGNAFADRVDAKDEQHGRFAEIRQVREALAALEARDAGKSRMRNRRSGHRDQFGGLLDETDDLDAVQAFARAGNFVTCYVEPDALGALLGFIRESAEIVDMRLRRRKWN